MTDTHLVTAFFHFENDALDKAAHSTMKERGGMPVGTGTFLPTGERDIAYSFPTSIAAEAVAASLRKAGFEKVNVDPDAKAA